MAWHHTETTRISLPQNIYTYIAAVINSYLLQCNILIICDAGISTHNLEKGWIQGYCFGTILLLLIANWIINEWESFLLYTFADDLTIFFLEPHPSGLDQEALVAHSVFYQLLESLHLQHSPVKFQALIFTKLRLLHCRNPVIRVNRIQDILQESTIFRKSNF